ncbi:MAG TPA: response regulator [Thermoplasmata archaeon]|nr:response regulator [Thermoplasmata archaeon]
MNAENYTILLVEDDPNDVLLIKRAFRKADLANPIQVVEDGERALDYLAGKGEFADRERYPHPVLVLLDLKLPKSSGFEVLAWIRRHPGMKRLPVIVLTSSQEISDINRAYELGANSYLVKPVNFDALLEMVRALNLYWMVLNVNLGVSDE